MNPQVVKIYLSLLLLLSAMCPSAACADKSLEKLYTPIQHLKNFALSSCLYGGYADAEIKRDALASLRGYKEFGSLSIDAYNAAAKLSDQFLAKNYVGEGGEKLTVMKCIDLFHSKELEQLAQKYNKNARLKKH